MKNEFKQFLKTTTKIKQLSYNPATAFLATSPRDMKIYIQANPYKNVHSSHICNRQN